MFEVQHSIYISLKFENFELKKICYKFGQDSMTIFEHCLIVLSYIKS